MKQLSGCFLKSPVSVCDQAAGVDLAEPRGERALARVRGKGRDSDQSGEIGPIGRLS
jgi:hypothetical protein